MDPIIFQQMKGKAEAKHAYFLFLLVSQIFNEIPIASLILQGFRVHHDSCWYLV